MRAILTGLNGTVAPQAAKTLREAGYEIIQYDRTVVSTENESAIKTFIKKVDPDVLLHFAVGSNEWTGKLAKLTYSMNIKYVYISSVSVFNPDQSHPFTKDLKPKPADEYGTYKLNGEKISSKANPKAYIARLSWQIGHDKGSNNMVEKLYKQMEEKGYIEASEAFYPSAAFLEDTAKGILQMLKKAPGIYHLNTNENLSLYDIVMRLKELHPDFKIKKTKDPSIDMRMTDSELDMPSLEVTLNSLINK